MHFCTQILTAGIGAKDSNIEWRPAVRMYRGMFLVILMIFLLGINTYGWRKSGVNHVLIFELDPRHNLSHEQLLEVSLKQYSEISGRLKQHFSLIPIDRYSLGKLMFKISVGYDFTLARYVE